MWHLVLRKYNGEYIRVEQEEPFDSHDIRQYEDYRSEYSVDKSKPYYDNHVKHEAVVVNIFKSLEG